MIVVACTTNAGPLPEARPTATPDVASIEARYAAPGEWMVATGSARDAYGGYTLYYPSDLGRGGFKHPLLTWGNGTFAAPAKYDDTLRHLASWGFVVIASDSQQTGLGREILEGARYMVRENADPSSIFFDKLDITNIGALGHSQGAGGTLNATIDSNGLIVSALTIELPDSRWWTTPLPDMARLTSPIFFINGGRDFIASEPAARDWYDRTGGPAAQATLADADHNYVQGAGNRLQGYITAWMMYTLEDDEVARSAFVGGPPGIGRNPWWQNQAGKRLP